MIRLKVNQRDLSPYLNVQHGDGLDPSPDYTEGQYSGTPAFGDGLTWVADSINNREMVFPLILTASSRANLHELIRDINQDLFRGASVEYADDANVDPSTFFDLERGNLVIQHEHFLKNQSAVRATLNLSVRPYGHTGTYRTLIPSVGATGPQTLSASAVMGDIDALTEMRVDTVASYLASAARRHVIAYGVARSASYQGVYPAANLSPLSASSALIGASGAVASQYLGFIASPAGSQSLLQVTFDPAAAYVGRQRIFALVRSNIAHTSTAPIISFSAYQGTASGPGAVKTTATAAATYSTTTRLLDFGEWALPSAMPSGAQPLADALRFHWHGVSGGSQVASPGVRVEAVISLPLDVAAGVHSASGWDWSATTARRVFHPNGVAHYVGSSTVLSDESAALRGTRLTIPPTGSPVASGPQRIVFFAGDPEAFVGNKPVGVGVNVRERFKYLR